MEDLEARGAGWTQPGEVIIAIAPHPRRARREGSTDTALHAWEALRKSVTPREEAGTTATSALHPMER